MTTRAVGTKIVRQHVKVAALVQEQAWIFVLHTATACTCTKAQCTMHAIHTQSIQRMGRDYQNTQPGMACVLHFKKQCSFLARMHARMHIDAHSRTFTHIHAHPRTHAHACLDGEGRII